MCAFRRSGEKFFKNDRNWSYFSGTVVDKTKLGRGGCSCVIGRRIPFLPKSAERALPPTRHTDVLVIDTGRASTGTPGPEVATSTSTGTPGPDVATSTSNGNLWFWATSSTSAVAALDDNEDRYVGIAEWVWEEDVRLRVGWTWEKCNENLRAYPNNGGDSQVRCTQACSATVLKNSSVIGLR